MALLLMLGAETANAQIIIPVVIAYPNTQPPAEIGHYENIHTVAIISAIGTNMTFQNYHFLSPATKRNDISNWNLDDWMTLSLKRYLSGRFQVKDITYDRNSFAQVPNGPWDSSNSKIRSLLGRLPLEGLDAIIIVRPDLEAQTPGLSGLALYNEGKGPVLWANYEIDIVDAHTLKRIAKAYSRVQTRDEERPQFASIAIGQDLKLDDNFELSDEQTVELRATTEELLRSSTLETLRALELDIELPSIGARDIAPISPSEDPFAAIKTVAVISSIGNELELTQQGGLAAASHTQDHLAISDWNIDQHIDALIRATINKRFVVKDVPVDATALTQDDPLATANDPDFRVPGLSRTSNIDAYILVLKCPIGFRTGDSVGHGVGIWNWWPIGGKYQSVYAYYRIAVVDAQTLRPIAVQIATLSPNFSGRRPILEMGDLVLSGDPPTLSPAQMKTVHTVLMKLLDDSIPETLLRMRLTGTTITDELPSARQVGVPSPPQ